MLYLFFFHIMSCYILFTPLLAACTALSLLSFYGYVGTAIFCIAAMSVVARPQQQQLMIIIGITSLLFCYSVAERQHRENTLKQWAHHAPRSVTGTIKHYFKHQATLVLQHGYTLRLILPKKNLPPLSPGDTLTVTGFYRQPLQAHNPGQFNRYTYSLYSKSLGKFIVKKISTHTPASPFSLSALAYHTKKAIVSQHNRHLNPPYSTLYSALIFGESQAVIDTEWKQIFKKAGLIHALVVSGSQVSLVLGILTHCLNACLIYRGYQLILLVPASIFFYLICGGGPSIARSMIMAFFLLSIRYFLGYKTTSTHVIAATALLMMILDPFVVFNIGAILSFLATFSLIHGVDSIVARLPKRLPTWFKTTCATTLAPWLYTSPSLLIQFHQLPVVSLISNFLLIHCIEWIVIVGFFSTLLGFIIEPLAHYGHLLARLLLQIITHVSAFLSTSDYAIINTANPLLLCALFSLGLICSLSQKLSGSLRISGVCICLFLITTIPLWLDDNKLKVLFIDVGQGDATLFSYKGITGLIDTGPPYDAKHGSILHSVLLPLLANQGINHLDYLILTHFDNDHVGNLMELLQSVPVSTLIHNGHLVSFLAKHRYVLPPELNTYQYCQGDRLHIDDVTFRFLQQCSNPLASKNNRSLVIQLQKNHHRLLLTGDIEKETESELVTHYGPALQSTVLKVAHHGSRTSSTPLFLQQVHPQHTVISAGTLNRYKHPHPSVLSRLKSSTIWRTDQHGAIRIRIGQSIHVSSYSPR